MTAPNRHSPQIVNKLIASLADDERERLSPYFEEIDYPSKSTLCTTGDPIEYVVFPHDAITSTLMELPEGSAVEVGLMGSEGVVGLDLIYGVRTSITTVIVQIPGRAVRMRTRDFEREVLQPKGYFYAMLLRYSRVFYGMVSQTAACNASHPLERRLARWLLMIHDRLQRDRFMLTQEFMALMLGVRRSTVTQAAQALRDAGAIDYDRGEMRILRRDLLEQYACGCYAVIRDIADSLFAQGDLVG